MGKRSDQKETNRTRIINAAKQAFDVLGFGGADLRSIAQGAGLSTGAIFAQFKGKCELYREVYGHDPISPEEGLALRARVAELEAMLIECAA